ncbi:hypothetical protein IW261DRAFT_1520551 [Armillaria novae-zelandiae]|uniref:Uncharacterized protein n=1 Tax=Armillaria novae-zelandiae TaxID=153914 RepID=A0AA39NJB0_9AGAR|nr:hypothetical protein IW261DRAFT_1520551 [Armillaria novae-zelandiae]
MGFIMTLGVVKDFYGGVLTVMNVLISWPTTTSQCFRHWITGHGYLMVHVPFFLVYVFDYVSERCGSISDFLDMAKRTCPALVAL